MELYRVYLSFGNHDVNHHHALFGIALCQDGIPLHVIEAITDDREAVERLVRLYNEEQLDPVHFEAAVEDYLYDLQI